MNRQKTIEFSIIIDTNVEKLILDTFALSKTKLKKFKLPKPFLAKSLRAKDQIALSIDIVNFQKVNPISSLEEVNIIEENEDFIALSKPANCHCHPQSYNETDNIISYLYQEKRYDLLKVNQENYDRGLMYRLDYATSGLLIYLKKQSDYLDMRENFHDYVEKKYYLAVVSGKYNGESSLIHLLKSTGVKGHKVIEDPEHHADTKFSRCDIEVIDYNHTENKTLLKVLLHQGHRHQIRAQLRIAGFPIVGDELYKGEKYQRLLLHCYEYHFNLAGKKYTVRDDSFELVRDLFNSDS